jgi:hypothetical protein
MALSPDEKILLVGNVHYRNEVEVKDGQSLRYKEGRILIYGVANPERPPVLLPESDKCGVPDSIVVTKGTKDARSALQLFVSVNDGAEIKKGGLQKMECKGG